MSWKTIIGGIKKIFHGDVAINGNAELGGDFTLQEGGTIRSSDGGDIVIAPTSGGITKIGTGTPSELIDEGGAYVTNLLEVDGETYLNGGILVISNGTNGQFYVGPISRFYGSSDGFEIQPGGSSQGVFWSGGGFTWGSNIFATNPGAENFLLEGDFRKWGKNGSLCSLKALMEEVTISVGQGSSGIATALNLSPGNSRIKQVMTRITQAPGGGATTLDVGRTSGGNLDEYADGTSVAIDATTIADNDGDGNTAMPHWNASDDTLTLTTDSDVTVSDMKVRVVVFYEEYTTPTS
jgi:hypothetical protein